MGKFRQILTKISVRDTPMFSFPDDNMSKCQRISTTLSACIDIKEIWFGIADRQISSMFDRIICPRHDNGGDIICLLFFFFFFSFSLKNEYQDYAYMYNRSHK